MTDGYPPKDYLLALGSAAYTWAHLEGTLDFIVAVTFQKFGRHPRHSEIPRLLRRKLEYLRDVSKLASLDPWRDRIAKLATDVANLKEERHDAIHGAAMAFSPEGVATLNRILYEKTIHRSKEVVVAPADLERLSNCAFVLSLAAIEITMELVRHLGLDVGDEEAAKLPQDSPKPARD